jgi:hypothetical protein
VQGKFKRFAAGIRWTTVAFAGLRPAGANSFRWAVNDAFPAQEGSGDIAWRQLSVGELEPDDSCLEGA